jgi:two-component system chemotaxis response regulator CheB
VKEAENGEPILPGNIYIAPPDHHMLVAQRSVSLTSSELVHFTRPSIDLLFESVAAAHGPHAIGVILTGSGYDGGTGLQAIKEQRGSTIVQDPRSSEHAGMPSNALASGCADFTLPLEEIGPAIVSLVDRGVYASVEGR